MIRSLLYLRTKPGRREELLHAIEQTGALEAASEQQGSLGVELQIPLDDEDTVLVTASWASPEHFEQWLGSTTREAILRDLEDLLAERPEPHVYRVVESVS